MRIFAVIVVVASLGLALSAAAAPAPQSGGTLSYGLIQSPDQLDPNLSPYRPSQIVYFQLFDTLIIRDKKDKSFKPHLATSWTISPDGRVYTFKLRPGLRFHDGTPLDAAAVKFNFDRTHDPKLATRIGDVAIGFYDHATVVDPLTVQIHLKSSWAPFLDAVSLYYRLVSPAAVRKYGDKDFGTHPVGSGPFKFVEWVPNDHITLARNEAYTWSAPTANHPGPAYLDSVVFRIIPEDGTRVAALENGEVQVIDTAPAQAFDQMVRSGKFQAVIGYAPGRPFSWAINVTKPPTDELAVRQALEYGINRPLIVNIVYGPYQRLGAYLPAFGDLTPYTWGYDKRAEIYHYDPSKAKALLDQAGWKPGPDGIRQKNGMRLTIPLGDWEHGAPEVMQDQLRAIGIDLKLFVLPALVVNENQRKGATLLSPLPAARTDPNTVSRLHSRYIGGGGFNFAFVNNPDLDRLLDQQAQEANPQKRLALLATIQETIMRQAYMLPVYDYDNISVKAARVQELQFNELGFFPILHDTWLAK
ncbi:MAG TPA: ABC transporter substrate-binding protein [bacterium]|nr:ABC transporter substrate-binding protein [bacterium]